MIESINEINRILDMVAERNEKFQRSEKFDIEQFLLDEGYGVNFSQRLNDFLPVACARIFLQELGIIHSDFYRRMAGKGKYGDLLRYDNEPMWETLISFALRISKNNERRNQFNLLVQQSAEFSTINKFSLGGGSIASLKGAKFSPSIFLTSVKPDN